jgi:hypothetical protein
MRIPMQAAPVSRGISTGAFSAEVAASGIFDWVRNKARWAACKACKFGCDRLPVGSGLCKRGCDRTVC